MHPTQNNPPLIGNANLEKLRQELREYVAWTREDSELMLAIFPRVEHSFHALVDDFYDELQRHPQLNEILISTNTSVEALKGRLLNWLAELFTRQDEPEFAARRWQIGWRHVEIGLSQVFVNVAISRLRLGLTKVLRDAVPDDSMQRQLTISAVNKALDLDLAIIQHAFETEQLRRKTEAARLRSEIRFRNLVEAATCMIVILREDGRVLYFSPFAEMLTGCAASDIQGKDYFERCIPAEYVEQARAYVIKISQGEPGPSVELPVAGVEGKTFWLAWNARWIEDMDERPVVLLVGHDITERKLAESRLVQAERLAAIGQMITGLAHESRNALQRINASTEMLEFEVEGNPQALELVHRSQKALDDIHRLFDEVRNYAAPIHLERSRLSLAAVWREAWELLVHLRRHRAVSLTEHLAETEPVAWVDRFRMVQVFRNLLENSLSACADPVQVVIACRTICRGEEQVQEVWLADSGPGFTSEARREALHPFFTTKTKGTGLGLAIVQRLVHAHGGTVELVGRDECPAEWRAEMTGAIVRIVLPAEMTRDDMNSLP